MQPHDMNGPENGVSSGNGQNGPPNITRPFTLQECLPYSPQTSTVPFLPDIVPDPTLGSGSPALGVSDLFPTQDYERLNREASDQAQGAKNVKQTVDHILHDLRPAQRTQYKFSVVPTRRRNAPRGKSLAEDLSPVAKAVYERVGGYFRATKPGKDISKPVNGGADATGKAHNDLSADKASGMTLPQGPRLDNESFKSPRSRIEVAIPSRRTIDPSSYIDTTNSELSNETLQTPSGPLPQPAPDGPPADLGQTSPFTKNGSFTIELPSTNFKREDYLEVVEPLETPFELSARRTGQSSNGIIGSSLDQRERGEAALETLDSLFRGIFSAVGQALAMEPGYDHLVRLSSNGEVTMTAATQQKMHSALQKVIGLRCFDRVPLENLIQLMKLSEVSLKQVQELDVRVDESWDEAAVDSWVLQLSEIEAALKAARTCLRLLAGGRDDKQLYSEALIHRCVELFKAVTEDVIVPLVEMRPSVGIFKLVTKHKKPVSAIFVCCQKLFALLAELVTKTELSETAINSLEFTASKLIFVENAYYEKESAVGVQKFDGIRSVAMDMLCQIFLIKPEQRQGIIDDILTSLEKLPVGKQSSRQFKLSDGGSIQPVSALIMRLVQASSGTVHVSNEGGRNAILRTLDEEDGIASDEQQSTTKQPRAASSITSEEQAAYQNGVAIQDVETAAAPLMDTATRNASYVVNFIVKRAIGSTKSGDTPYRNLLDLFVDDFTTCLESPDWPSAELLLRLLMLMMVQLFEAGKTAAPAKNMALELLGVMSAAISRLRSHVKKTASSFEGGDSDSLSRFLSDLATYVLERKSQIDHLVSWAGPYRATLEYVQQRCSEDPHLSSAVSFLITDWATRIHTGYDTISDDEEERNQEFGKIAYRLRMMIEDQRWLSNEYTFKAVTANQARLSYSIILLQSPLCESFNKILNILLGSMASDQATVRSKSLKSVNQVLETDPSILDGDSSVIQLILDCSSDSSTQVRDSALGLLGSCIGMRPALEPSLTPKIIDRFQDAGVGVRKRAMKLARDIYLRNDNKSIRSAIANGLLRRVQDPDEGVRELARQMMEEIWFAPFYSHEDTAAFETSLTEHVTLIIHTVKTGTVTEMLDKVFRTILRPQNKSLEGPFAVCSMLVKNMFALMDNPDSDDPTVPSGRDALQVLTIFAKADPKLFNFEQIRLLKPQLASFTGVDELAAFRAVTVVYKRVLPELPTVHSDFLVDVRRQLQGGIGKISSRGALDDLFACARVVCDLLKDFGPLANLVASSLLGINKVAALKRPPAARELNMLSAYSIIVGLVAKHCDLDQQIQILRNRFPSWKGDSVPRLIVDTLVPFASPNQSLDARKAALEAIGLVCQSWPRNYVIAKVYTLFQQVFQDQIPILETMILRSFKEFLMAEEKRSETATEATSGEKKKKKELTVMGGTNFDDVASATTQRFLKDITRISVSSQDEHAFLAMEVLGSINRQGLTHPKETGVTLITLETSSNRKIAELAFQEHRALHEKHETVLEREYVKAVQSAYNYQRDIVKDSHGATTDPFMPKLYMLMDVLKISKMKSRQRFLEKLCSQVDFDLGKLDVPPDVTIPTHVDFSRFIAENLAFFEYQTVGELQTTVNNVENMVTGTGATVAQAIESELFNVTIDANPQHAVDPVADPLAMSGQEANGQMENPVSQAVVPSIDDGRLRQLTAASMILLSIWEVRTHLRRLYGMGSNRNDSKAKALAKDLNKAPNKVQGVHGERIWDELTSHMTGLESQAKMYEKCKAFVELLHVDKEFKVTEDDDGMDVDAPSTPSEGDDDDDGGERGRKRKGTGTPGGRKKRPRSSSQARKRGRARKQSTDATDEADLDGDWI